VRPKSAASGFTIIEVLIALSILVTVLAISSTPIINAFSMSARSRRAVSGTSAAQQVLETVRAQWQTQNTYDNTCLNNYTLPTGVTVAVSAFDARYNAFATPTPSLTASATTCSGTTATAAPIKRVTVTSTSNSTTQATVTLEIARP
jgi:prepilin-type N-terminal cleavage/methylation domain-containing protein